MTSRNKHFHGREPFRHDRLTLEHAGGPFGFLNPTKAHFRCEPEDLSSAKTGGTQDEENSQPHGADDQERLKHQDSSEEVPAKDVRFIWRSRDNRKGRHALLVEKPAAGEESRFMVPRRTTHYKEVLKNIKLTLTYYPVWDISWLVAFVFTWGSVVWVMNVGIGVC